MSTSTEYMDGLNAPVERRFYPRVAPPVPVWVAFGPNNLGVLHDLSENGFQITTPASLALNSVYRVLIPLKSPKKTIVVTVRTIWTNEDENRSGIQLLDLSEEDRMHVRQIVDSELARYEAEPSEPGPAPTETQSPVFKHAAVHDDEAGSVNSWPAEWQREDWQNMDVEHWAGTEASEPAQDSQEHGEPTDVRGDLGATEQWQSERESHPQFAPQSSNENEVAEPTEPLSSVERTEVTNGEAHTSAAEVAPSETEPPAAPLLGTWAQEPPPREDQRPRSWIPEPQHFSRKAVAAESSAASESALPPIANPFEDPAPQSRFQQFPPVPLPIHGEFEYASQPSKQRRRPNVSSRMRAKPLIIWAAVLALVCFGANELVRYKLKLNSQRYASESAKYAQPKAGSAGTDSTTPVDEWGANAANSTEADSQSAAKDQPASRTPSGAVSASAAPASQAGRGLESSLGARDNSAYTATAPPAPAADRSQYASSASQAAAPRTWSAPAPNHTASSVVSPNDAPQSPNVTDSSDNTPAPSAAIVAEGRPIPPAATPVQPQATNSTPANANSAENSSSATNNAPARTQQPSGAQSQSSASNTPPGNASTARQQSQIYNANSPQQRSAIINSISSVHSSGIFDSKDATGASGTPSSPSRGNNNANAGGNANVATRNVANNSVAPTDTPQERDLEIAAPKGFTASYVDLPGEHVVRTSTATVRMRRFVRVPGERIPGQRWLWRGKLNVTLGDVVNRIDPSVVQASGASGSLTVQATIDKDGYVTDLKPITGNFAMLPSVSRAVRNWHYEPTYLDNKRAETQAEIEFDLRSTAASTRNPQR